MLKRALLVLLLSLAVLTPGCAAVQKWLPIATDILTVIVEAQAKVQQAEALAAPIVKLLPADKQAAIAKAQAEVDRALAALATTAHGARDAIAQQDLDKAFAEFADAWRQWTLLLQDVGAMATAGSMHTMRAGPGGPPVVIEDPIAARPHPVLVGQ